MVLAVELANEPHTSDNYERLHGQQPGSLIRMWSCVMASYIKSIDKNHLVTPLQDLRFDLCVMATFIKSKLLILIWLECATFVSSPGHDHMVMSFPLYISLRP